MKKIFTAFVIIYGFLSNADAQTAISNEKIFHDGKNVTVTFDLDTDNPDIPSRHKEVILPYLYNGKDTLYLDAMEIYGKGRYKRERQVNAINGDRKWELSDNQTLKNKGTYTYVSQVPLKRWMTVARLGLRRQLVGCACEKEMPADSNIAQAELFKVPEVVRRTPSYVLTRPSANWDFGKDELEILDCKESPELIHRVLYMCADKMIHENKSAAWYITVDVDGTQWEGRRKDGVMEEGHSLHLQPIKTK